MDKILDKYDITIGLEIHAELNTATKAFCGCANDFGSVPNTNCCPVCLAMPGALPVLNRMAVEKTIAAGISMGCEINELGIFERKHYFYPDLSKAYQISQLVRPICLGGGIKLKSDKFIRLNRIHLEEDAGKLLHNAVSQTSLVDYNRGGVPLIEIVTEPDISSIAEAIEFLEEVRSRLVFAGVADCRMEQGGMRCDVNLSLKPKGATKLGNRAEMKNLNSFKMVGRAIEYEAKRQAEILDGGGKISPETRKWDESKGKTLPMRSKGDFQEYCYIPDPDIYPVRITREDVEKIRVKMPTLAHELRERLVTEFGLPEYDADVITKTRDRAKFYLDCVAHYNEPKQISNWLMVDLLNRMNDLDLEDFPIAPKDFCDIIKMTQDKIVTKLVGLQILDEVIRLSLSSEWKAGSSVSELAKKMGLLVTVTDEQIIGILDGLRKEKPNLPVDYLANKQKVLPFIIGQVMKQTQGRAKSDIVEALIERTFK